MSQPTHSQGQRRAFWAMTSLLILAGTATLAAGDCVTASVTEPIRLPGGSEHPPSVVTVCVIKHLSPVAALHKTYVDGMPIGMMVSRRDYSEGIVADARPFMMFHRDATGRLQLYGVGTPAGNRVATYLLGEGFGAPRRVREARDGKKRAKSDRVAKAALGIHP